MEIIKGKVKQPPRIVIFGTSGIGKSTLGSTFPSAIFIDTEGRLAHIDCEHFPTVQSFQEVEKQLEFIQSEPHNYKTLVIDSLDWLDSLIAKECAQQLNVKTLADIPYGKGFAFQYSKWEDLLHKLSNIRLKRNMMIVGIGHAQIKRFEAPDTESYDQYRLNLRDNISDRIVQWSDCVFFANYKTRVREGDDKIKRGVSTGKRVLYTKNSPAYTAKDSYGMPDELDMSWQVIGTHLKNFYVGKVKAVEAVPEVKKVDVDIKQIPEQTIVKQPILATPVVPNQQQIVDAPMRIDNNILNTDKII